LKARGERLVLRLGQRWVRWQPLLFFGTLVKVDGADEGSRAGEEADRWDAPEREVADPGT
jgi:hypothetical protein